MKALTGVLWLSALVLSASVRAAFGPGWVEVPENPPAQPPAFGTGGGSLGALNQPTPWLPCAPANTSTGQPRISEYISPEIRSLAANLENDPLRIYNYVKNYIKYIHYFGSKKGALLTLLEGSGNDFDQCALLCALLRAAQEATGAAYAVTYQFGAMNIPYTDDTTNMDLRHWLGLSLQREASDPPLNYSQIFNLVNTTNERRGFPRYQPADPYVGQGYFVLLRGNHRHNFFVFHRLWLKLAYASGPTYYLDPSFKASDFIPRGFSVATALNGGATDLLNACIDPSINSEVTADYVKKLSWQNISSRLSTYSDSLLAYLEGAERNYSVSEALGGNRIQEQRFATLPQEFPFEVLCGSFTLHDGSSVNIPVLEWENIPGLYLSRLDIAAPNDGLSLPYYLPELRGRKLSLSFPNGLAQIALDDVPQATAPSGSGAESSVTLFVHHPFGVWDFRTSLYRVEERYDQFHTTSYKRDGMYVIGYAFDDPVGQLNRRQKITEGRLRTGASPASKEVVTDTLELMGLNWLQQSYWAHSGIAAQNDVLTFYHHAIGRIGQEVTPRHRYFVDFGLRASADMWQAGDPLNLAISKRPLVTRLKTLFSSALEHSVIEQLQGVASISTIKAIFLANQSGQKLMLGTAANSSVIATHLNNETIRRYSSAEINTLIGQMSGDATMLLPSGEAQLGNSTSPWTGYAYLKESASGGSQTVIERSLNGGSTGDEAQVDPGAAVENGRTAPEATNTAPPTQPAVKGADPVNMLDGSFTLDAIDLSVGQPEPRGFSFSRHYDTNRRYRNEAGMAAGWTHNYNIRIAQRSDSGAAFGRRSLAEMAPFLAAITVAADVLGGTPDASNPLSKRWAVAALITEWAIDQIPANAAAVTMGQESIQFIKRPSGGYISPAGITMSLSRAGAVYSMRERNGRNFVFDGLSRIKQIIDPYGKTMNFGYNSGSGLLETVTDCWGPNARTLTLQYTGSPLRLTSVLDGTGRTVRFGYDTIYNNDGDLVNFSDAETKVWRYEYDSEHKIKKTKDPMIPTPRVIVENTYDIDGRITQQLSSGDATKPWAIFITDRESVEKDPAGGRKTYYYDEKKRLIAVKDGNGNRTEYKYDGQDHLVQTVLPEDHQSENITAKIEVTTYNYDGKNNLRKVTDALQKFASYEYDGNLRLKSYTDFRQNTTAYTYTPEHAIETITAPNINNDSAMPNKTEFHYFPDGTLEWQKDGDGYITRLQYDNWGQMKQKTYPLITGESTAHFETFTPNARGDVLSHADAKGVITDFDFNDRRQLKKTTVHRPGRSDIIFENIYDEAGNLWKTVDARFNTTVRAYSPTQKLLNETYPALESGESPAVILEYDKRDWLKTRTTAVTASTSASVQQEFDFAGNVQKITDELGKGTRYEHDKDGRRTAVISPLTTAEQKTTFGFNVRGEQLTMTDALQHTVSFGHDENGNLQSTFNRRQKTFRSTYYNDNRLWTSSTPLGKTTTRRYNKRGLLSSLKEPSQQETTYDYDERGRLKIKSDPVGVTSFAYDRNNNLESRTENGRTTRREYDELNRVKKYTSEDNQVISYDYDNNGNLKTLTYPGGTKVVTYEYDSNNRLKTVTDWAQRVTSFEYDLAGHLKKVIRPNHTTREVDYDLAGQVKEIRELGPDGRPFAFFKLNYDEARRQRDEFIAPIPAPYTEPTQTITYDDDNRIQSFNGLTVIHDDDGNMTTGPLNGSSLVTYVYDARNRLTSVGASGSVPALSYGYDSEGNRTSVTQGTQTTRYVVDPTPGLSRVLIRAKPDNSNTYYVYGLGLLYEVDDAGTTVTYHYDSRGSTVALTSGAGVVTDRVEYSTYGLATRRTGTTDTPFLYNGRYGVMTDANGLCHMRARYYNAYIKRFLNADPAGMGGGLNWYAYADGNPISLIDPFGLGTQDSGEGYWTKVGKTILGFTKQTAKNVGYVIGQFLNPRDVVYGAMNTIANPKEALSGIVKSVEETGRDLTGPNAEASGEAAANVMFIFLPGGKKIPVKPGAYSVAFETKLSAGSYPGISRAAHFQEANGALLSTMEADSQFAQMMRDVGVNLERTTTGLAPRGAPDGWSWHHAQEPGLMQLVPREQHAPGSAFQYLLHPDGQGGYARWGQ